MNSLTVYADRGKARISKHIYGHFIETPSTAIYPGLWVGEDSAIPNTRGIRNDVVEALKGIKVPNIRWPGGATAEFYHWQDAIGPRDQRPGDDETYGSEKARLHDFGTHEFMDLCEMLDCEPYICFNTCSGSIEEMQNWVDYLNEDEGPMADLRKSNGRDKPWMGRLWAVGNEGWAFGDDPMPYTRRYLDIINGLNAPKGRELYRVSCGPGGTRYDWTDTLMREFGDQVEGMSFHHYTLAGPWQDKGPCIDFDEDRWALSVQNTVGIESMIYKHSQIMDHYDPEKRVAIVMDEWGTWHGDADENFPFQQNTLRDGVVAAILMNTFNNHCERVRIANIAMMVNVLQAMCLTMDDKMLLTPTYHAFEMFTPHHEATMLPCVVTSDRYLPYDYFTQAFNASVSRNDEGKIFMTLCNVRPDKEIEVACELRGAEATKIKGRVMTGDAINSHNTFENPNNVKPVEFDDAKAEGSKVTVKLPARSIVSLELT